jgi:hypothetical protein
MTEQRVQRHASSRAIHIGSDVLRYAGVAGLYVENRGPTGQS